MDKPWALPALIGAACILAGGATASVPAISGAFVLAAVGCFVVAVLNTRRDPYSLKSLQEIHEKEELREIDVPGVLDDPEGDVMCGRCRNHYSGRLKGCPFCGAAR